MSLSFALFVCVWVCVGKFVCLVVVFVCLVGLKYFAHPQKKCQNFHPLVSITTKLSGHLGKNCRKYVEKRE